MKKSGEFQFAVEIAHKAVILILLFLYIENSPSILYLTFLFLPTFNRLESTIGISITRWLDWPRAMLKGPKRTFVVVLGVESS